MKGQANEIARLVDENQKVRALKLRTEDHVQNHAKRNLQAHRPPVDQTAILHQVSFNQVSAEALQEPGQVTGLGEQQ